MGCLISKSRRTKGKDKDYARKSVMSSPSKRIKRTENNYADISCINESKRISAGDWCLSSNETQSKTGSTVDGGFLSDEKHNEDEKTADECLSSDEKQNKKESTADGCLLFDEKQNEEGSTAPEPPEPLDPWPALDPWPGLDRWPALDPWPAPEPPEQSVQDREWRRFDRNYSKELKQTSVEIIQPHQDQPQVWVPPPPPDPPNPQ